MEYKNCRISNKILKNSDRIIKKRLQNYQISNIEYYLNPKSEGPNNILANTVHVKEKVKVFELIRFYLIPPYVFFSKVLLKNREYKVY